MWSSVIYMMTSTDSPTSYDEDFKLYDITKRESTKEVEQKLYERIIPGDAQMKLVYDLIKTAFCLDEVVQRGLKAGINYCMLRIITDVFAEMGLVELNPVTGVLKTVKTEIKANLQESQILMQLREKTK